MLKNNLHFRSAGLVDFTEQVQVFPAESSGTTDDIRFQVRPPADNNDSVFDYDKGNDEISFDLEVTGNDPLQTDTKKFTIILEVLKNSYGWTTELNTFFRVAG